MQLPAPSPDNEYRQELARTLDVECLRVARVEQLPMERLMNDLAQVTGRKARELYNWRSCKWPIPSDVLPILCKRLGSFRLLEVVREQCRAERVPLPDPLDLVSLVAQTVREDMEHYGFLIAAFE